MKLSGPWRGQDMRANPSDGTASLSINCDTSRGLIEARAPLVVRGSGAPYRARLHLVDRPTLAKRLLAVGPSSYSSGGGPDIEFRVFDPSSLEAGEDLQSITTDLGEGRDEAVKGWTCSFVDTFLGASDGSSHPVTLVVTPTSTYVYDPIENEYFLRRPVISTDAVRLNGLNIGYASIPLCGPISAEHQGRVYYSGFPSGYQVPLSLTIPTSQSSIPEHSVSTDRSYLTFDGSVLAWSDEFDPFGVRADHFVSVQAHETIRGIHSTQDALYVFTDRSIYALVGYSDETYALQKVVSGSPSSGCISHQSIVAHAGIIYYVAADGVYAFGGIASPELIKISDGIDPLFRGFSGVEDHLADSLRSRLTQSYGYPWVICQADLHLCNGKFDPRRDQIHWSVSTTGAWAPRTQNLSLVYDVAHRGFSLYAMSVSSRSNGNQNGPGCDFAVIGDKWVTSNCLGELQVSEPGSLSEGKLSDNPMGVPMFWSSQRIGDNGDDILAVTDSYLHMLSWGVPVTAGGLPTVGSGAVAYDLPMVTIEGEEASWDQQTPEGAERTGYTDRKTKTQAIACHPQVNASYFLSDADCKYGTVKWASKDWFRSRINQEHHSRWLKITIIDDPCTTTTRGNILKVKAITVNVKSTGSTRA